MRGLQELRVKESDRLEATAAMLRVNGVDVEISGEYSDKTEGAVAAFQRHFRPERVDGLADLLDALGTPGPANQRRDPQ